MTQTAQNPLNQIAEISTTNPGKKGLAPDAMDLGYTVRLDLGQSLSPNIGLSSVPKVPVARQTYSLFQANSQLKVETSVTEVDVASTFQKTSNGIYQYSQLLSMNENNDRSALFEQRRMINQNAYNIDWGARSVARFDDNGNLEGDARFKDILTILTDTKKSKPLIDSCMADTNKSYQDCFNKVHGQTLDRLTKIDGSLRFEDGMIVRSLTENESKLLGLSPIQDPKQPDARHGICYINPNDPECVALKLLRKDFDVDFNESTRVATFTKIISNGKIGGRNAKGEYISGTQAERRSMYLSSVDPVMAPKGKDLFDIWGNDDWKDLEAQNMAVNQTFYSRKLTADSKTIQSSVASILKVESENDAKFRKAKQDQEAQDSLIKDLIIAYISGGMAGVKGAIKSKVEDKINASLAEAWARASGADEDQIALLTQAVSFLRGKVAEKKIKKDMAKNNLTNAGMAVVAGGLSYATGGMSNLLMANGPMAAMNVFGGGVSNMFGAASGLLSNPMVVGATAAFGQAAASITMGVTNAAYRGIAGDKKADAFTNKMTGPKDRLAAIKANEQSIIQSHVTQAVAKSTGLPMEVVGNIITDYKGAQAAKKVRNAVNGNPFANIGTQVVGAVGGIIKTAIVATGMPERDIQKSFSDGNRMLFAGSRDSTLEAQTLAYTNQAFGMKAPGTSYTSSTPTLKDKKGFVKELFQREAVNQLSVGMSEDERAVLNSALRGTISRVEQSKADKKARAEAVRSTVVTAVTTAVTLGAASGLSVFSSIGQTVSNGINAVARFLGSGFTMAATAAPHVGAAVINAGIQMADGARNGVDGMTAGFLNGAIGVFTAGGAFDFGEVTDAVTKVTSKSTLGLGVSYDRQNGWGGMLGVGGASANASISFSQRGNTTINGSWNTGFRGVQVTASSTTNGEQTLGANFNPSNEGPRRGWNIGANYDFNGGGASANVGYTDAATGLGLTSTIDRNGLSTSSSLNGNNYGTMTQDGYTAEEFNWAQNNINMAQNRTDDLARDANSIDVLKKSGMSDADINAMSPEDRDRAANKILREKENKKLQDSGKTPEEIARMTEYEREQALDRLEGVATIDNFTADDIARAALGLVGAFTGIAGLAFAGGTTGNNVPNRSHAVTPEVLARNEEEDSEVAVDSDGNPLPPKPMKMPERVADIVPPKPAEQTKLPSAPKPKAHPGKEPDVKAKPPKAELPPRPGIAATVPVSDSNNGSLTDRLVKLGKDGLQIAGDVVGAIIGPVDLSGQDIPRNPQSSRILTEYSANQSKAFLKHAKELDTRIKARIKPENYSPEGKALLAERNNLNDQMSIIMIFGDYKEKDLQLRDAEKAKKVLEQQIKKFIDEKKSPNSLEVKSWKDALARTNKSILDLQKSMSDQLKPYSSKLAEVNRKLNDYEKAFEKSAKQSERNRKLVEITAEILASESADFNGDEKSKLQTLYDNYQKAVKDLNAVALDPNDPKSRDKFDKAIKARKKAESALYESSTGKDILRTLDLSTRPDVDLDVKYPDLDDSYVVKETVFSLNNAQRKMIHELRSGLESRDIQDPVKRKTIAELQEKAETAKANLEKKLQEVSPKINQLNIEFSKKMAEINAGNFSEKVKESKIKSLTSEHKGKMDRLTQKESSEYATADAKYKKERVYAAILEDPSLNTNLPLDSKDTKQLPFENTKAAIYDLFYSGDEKKMASAANALFDSKMNLGQTGPLGDRKLVDKLVPTEDNTLREGTGHIRTFEFMGKEIMIPGVAGENISSDFGVRHDPTTGNDARHGALDNAIPVGTRIGFPVGGEVIEFREGGDSEINSLHKTGGQYVVIKIDNSDLVIKVQHNSKLLVPRGKDTKVLPGQAIALSGNSGRSTGPHAHIQFEKILPDGKRELFIPEKAEDLEILRKAGLVR
ncbi:peptidoglycan DD-metalloendopeptidase family protein [Leptospira ryugenii]|uniref:peptidoglycan DD-metalloendopeptidase family protein n=1 Tax=Leptospira ryugenii TaxID=1917863 RepID=UPI001AE84502|nr:peptidoglycan DD-metalloendopeptidase family protein [Leptospira ryugenii]